MIWDPLAERTLTLQPAQNIGQTVDPTATRLHSSANQLHAVPVMRYRGGISSLQLLKVCAPIRGSGRTHVSCGSTVVGFQLEIKSLLDRFTVDRNIHRGLILNRRDAGNQRRKILLD